MDIRKTISKFLTQICEKNYAQANESLKTIIEAKTKQKIEKTVKSKSIDKKPSKKEKDAFVLKKTKNQNLKKVTKKVTK
jgi:hypothetical protein